MSRLLGVFFDLDNTLIQARQAQRTAFVAVWEEVLGPRFTAETERLPQAVRAAYDRRFGYGQPGYAELSRISVSDFYRRILVDGCAACGIDPEDCLDRLVEASAEAERNALALAGDASVTLETLRAAGLTLGLITNGPSALQRDKLAVLALTEVFDLVVIDTEFGHPKPDRRIFDHAAHTVGLSASELLFIGDSLAHDVAGSRAAGWTAVWYDPGETPVPPDTEPPHHTVRALAELLTLPAVADVLGARHT